MTITSVKKFFTQSQTSKNVKKSQRKIQEFDDETISVDTQTQNITQKKNDKSQLTFETLLKNTLFDDEKIVDNFV